MKKTIAALLLSAALLLPLCACGEGRPSAREPLPDPDPKTAVAPQERGELQKTDVPEDAPTHEDDGASKTQNEEKVRYVSVKVDGLNVRTGAGTGYAALGTAQKNTLLSFDGREGNWIRTRYCGKTAYVSANERYVDVFEMEKGDETVEKVVDEGLTLLGTPYVYGAVRLHDGRGNFLRGFSADAFDCSSLMQYIFYRGAGVVLDVTTRTQVLQGMSVSLKEIRRGDLLFFTNASRKNKTGLERVGHVALYLGGNYILHTASDFAKIEEISALRWSYFLAARRVV